MKRSFLEGRAFVDVDDLNRQLEVWLDGVANVRVHGTTKVRPVDRYGADQAAMRPLAAVPRYDARPIEHRRVGNDCHLSYHGVHYSVHPDAAGHTVVVRTEADRVGATFTVYLGSQIVARHRRRPTGSPRVTLREHAEAIRRRVMGRTASRAPRRQPRFEQLAETPAASPGPWLYAIDGPAVQERSLQAYDAMAAT